MKLGVFILGFVGKVWQKLESRWVRSDRRNGLITCYKAVFPAIKSATAIT